MLKYEQSAERFVFTLKSQNILLHSSCTLDRGCVCVRRLLKQLQL